LFTTNRRAADSVTSGRENRCNFRELLGFPLETGNTVLEDHYVLERPLKINSSNIVPKLKRTFSA